ncbi:MAG: hypothetical protein HOC23_17985 [Halieaceae bacterium]|jgi:photosystem II stability/assembly factor-like uncharacterized protein|nr:hypothetical protein [Halieaceae bacterium]
MHDKETLSRFGGALRMASGRFLLSLWVLIAVSTNADNALIMPRASESLLLDVANAGNRLVACGEQGHILYSDDHGLHWNQAQVPTRQMLTAIHFPSATRGWAVGHDGLILATEDGGAHWTVQRDGLSEQQLLNRDTLQRLQGQRRTLEQTMLEASSIEQRAQLRQQLEDLELDLLDAQEVVNEPVHAPPLLDVFFTDALRGFAVGAFNTLLQTSDGGVRWQLVSQRLDNPDEYHLNAITGDQEGNLWIATESGLLLRSRDKGDRWQRLTSVHRGSWFGLVHESASDTLLVFGLRGKVLRSADGGDTWRRIETGIERSLAGGHFVSSQYVLLVGAAGTVLVSADGGRSFREHTTGARLHLSAVVNTGARTVLVGQGGLQETHAFGAGQ